LTFNRTVKYLEKNSPVYNAQLGQCLIWPGCQQRQIWQCGEYDTRQRAVHHVMNKNLISLCNYIIIPYKMFQCQAQCYSVMLLTYSSVELSCYLIFPGRCLFHHLYHFILNNKESSTFETASTWCRKKQYQSLI
jgi:hypothetical protein